MGPTKGINIFKYFRIVDDPSTFSYDVYPDELIVKKENEDLCQASFFDLLIELLDRKFTTD